ncbi:hypothetical protein HMPREF9624_01740 [Oribacterium asaccharolyticum ACB7]|uniref:Uncharacterized protein n=1 Tax=Oribacterium asaccharolyticum ACB7 TaxID=796944 RepID=G9WRM4_9FIRM|nr:MULTISPECIES: hypothetical protein [Oribacterium]EGL38235.1 hypothetical protein HMPREF9124_0567 [Oribacterium sp. oral taxon 108 str. F0425]EHL13964.1 hypothetical protein HMPREF9624_01740 [Oribacterium asaccharolyticum ACB7]
MRMNLRTFEIFVTSILVFSLFGILSILPEIRYISFALVLTSLFFLYEIEKEWQRRRKKAVFYKKMERIIARRLSGE